ncbi:NUDIX domain-containing protein [Streptomyces sp. DSM 44915]|uniref:NUDIX domain-containing protein n=1 Tax=Streptomyces chisholmiae TaxID=3075540 RepID=A0ABU2JUI7_9ACTN|nr:NUDIX domain-containing protein [Streptomyces sp. DSM 44915]MDT0268650.1 NUDIX domain-containing protein [Streptomyces sp. DSM 44915]
MRQPPHPPHGEAAALVTDPHGRVLLVPAADGTLALPTGPTGDRSPPAAARHAVRAATGLTPRLGPTLLSDWRPTGAGGTIRHVFDAGEISANAARRLTDRAITFLAPEALAQALPPEEVGRVRAALRARRTGTPAYTERGHPPPVLDAVTRFGIAPAVQSAGAWTWRPGPVPAELPVRQAWVWLFVPDGRVVAFVSATGLFGLPGGTLEPRDGGDAVAAAVREVREEVNSEMTPPVHLGYLVDRTPDGPVVARVRLAARATAVRPAARDPHTGTVHRRLLVPPDLVPELTGAGPDGEPQARAAVAAAAGWGLPDGAGAGVEEIPAAGIAPASLCPPPRRRPAGRPPGTRETRA